MKFDVSGTEVNYYFRCSTELWYFAQHITMEDNSPLVLAGRNTHEFSYQARSQTGREFELERVKIDFFDRKEKLIHEVKHSKKKSEAHVWQVKYYLLVLRERGYGDIRGILEYPHVKLKEEIILSDSDVITLQAALQDIVKIKEQKIPPPAMLAKGCKDCSYYELCFAGESQTEAEENI